jgi:acetoacetyl-CoA synthetase
LQFGSAEIYAVTERFPQVQDAICIGQRRQDDLDEQVILFLKLNPDFKLTPQLTIQIKDAIKAALSARHVPKYVFEVQDIPYTYVPMR